MASVSIRHVTKSFGENVVLRDFHETFQDGEFITLLGPSGCGKTTMLRMIAGFEKPTTGEIYIDDQLVSGRKTFVPPEKRNIGMVFQSYAVWPHMNVFDNVAYPLTIKKVNRTEIKNSVDRILGIVHLSQYAGRLPNQLSGGQQQRVALARALVSAPKLLLLDEPLSNLDAKLRESMRFEIKEIQKQLGITVVYVTHDQTEAMAMSDRIFLINRGEVQQSGSPQEIYNQLLILLNSALAGTDRYLFNGHTNVNLNNRFNVINVHKLLNMPDNVKNAQFSNITQYVWLALTKDRAERSILAVDEAHLFINKGSQATFEFLGQLCKRARKYSSGLWIMTQNISDFLHPEVARYGEAVLNNSATKLIMKSDATDLQKIGSLFQLNEGEQTLIKNSGVGQGLLIAGDMRVYANIEIEPEILRLCQAGGGK